MKFLSTLTAVSLLLCNTLEVVAHPQPVDTQLLTREQAERLDARHNEIFGDAQELWKRKGGGGGGGKGGGGGGGKTGSSGTSGTSGRGSSSSNAGGLTKTGSGVTPNYGGGRYYGGGAKAPYTSGARSPLGIVPVVAGVGLLAVYPGIWLYGAYSYPYYHPYSFHNRTGRRNNTNTNTTRTRELHFDIEIRQDDSGVNETKPVICLCEMYLVCGCDDDGNSTFLDNIIGDGNYANLNKTLVTVADVDGNSTILINGTLPNGTTGAGGTEDALSAASRSIIESSGYWVMVALVGMAVLV